MTHAVDRIHSTLPTDNWQRQTGLERITTPLNHTSTASNGPQHWHSKHYNVSFQTQPSHSFTATFIIRGSRAKATDFALSTMAAAGHWVFQRDINTKHYIHYQSHTSSKLSSHAV